MSRLGRHGAVGRDHPPALSDDRDAPAVGEMMAALVTGADSPVSLSPFRLARFAERAAGGTFVASYLG